MIYHELNLISVPTLVRGGRSVDDRGSLGYVNSLELSQFKRFYTVRNHARGFIRAWHGHMLESKAITCIRGSVLISTVELSDTISPSRESIPARFVITAEDPSALLIPQGFANGFMTLTEDAEILVFSTSTVEESKGDDYRFPFDYWNPWQIEFR